MNVWNFVSGYVKIKIMGDYPERLINRASAQGIPFSDAEALSDGSAVCCIPVSRLKTLRFCARDSGCRVRIVSKHGLPCALIAVKHRLSLFLLAVCFIAILAFASTRVLAFDIECGDFDRDLIFDCLADLGIRRGICVKTVHTAEICKRLDSLPGVVNAEVDLRGVVLHIKVIGDDTGLSAYEPYSQDSMTGAPIGIFAAKDCVIASIYPTRGRALYRSGDAVKAGELLISGDYTDLKPGYYVDADGRVLGRVLYRAEATVQSQCVMLRRTGERVELNVFYLFGRKLFFSPPYENYELESILRARFDCSPAAAFVSNCYCFELRALPTELSEAEIKQAAEAEAQSKLFENIPEDAELISLTTDFVLDPDGSITATVTAVSLENIGYKRGIYD